MGLLRFIFWFFVISYLIKILARLLAPMLIKRFANKMQNRFNQQYQSQQKKPPNEGKITIENNSNTTIKNSKNLGEYVDFEEVDE